MRWIDRVFVLMASLFVGLFLFSIAGTEAAFALPVLGLAYVIFGRNRQ